MEFMQHTFRGYLTPQFDWLKESYVQPSEWKQFHDTHKQRWGEHNPLESTGETGLVFSKQNPGPCLEVERVKCLDDKYEYPLQKIQLPTSEKHSSALVSTSRIPFDILIRSLIPHLDESKVRQLQLHFTKLRRNEINILDFMRFTRHIAGSQLLRWTADSIQLQTPTHLSSAPAPLRSGIMTPLKRLATWQQEPHGAPEEHFSLPTCKKKKTSEASIEQRTGELNAITALGGVNMREEEQLVAGHEDELYISGETQKVIQEEGLILLKIPLQRKLAKIISKHGIASMGDNVERCLSMCVEERMRQLIHDLIRLSKMRVGFEAEIHQAFITSDVQLQILMINQEAQKVCAERQTEDQANKVAEDNKQTTVNKTLTNGVGTTLRADDILSKWQLMAEQAREKRERRICSDNKFVVDTKAVNLAIRTAVGGDDLILKWQLMAEQGWDKSEGKLCSKHDSNPKEEPKNTSSFPTGLRRRKRVRRISVRDIIAVLEREPQMSKSTLLYRLHEKHMLVQ